MKENATEKRRGERYKRERERREKEREKSWTHSLTVIVYERERRRDW